MLPIWHKENGKWYLIPNRVRDRLKPGDILRYDTETKYWTIVGPGFYSSMHSLSGEVEG